MACPRGYSINFKWYFRQRIRPLIAFELHVKYCFLASQPKKIFRWPVLSETPCRIFRRSYVHVNCHFTLRTHLVLPFCSEWCVKQAVVIYLYPQGHSPYLFFSCMLDWAVFWLWEAKKQRQYSLRSVEKIAMKMKFFIKLIPIQFLKFLCEFENNALNTLLFNAHY